MGTRIHKADMGHFLVPESGENKATMTFLGKISIISFKVAQIQNKISEKERNYIIYLSNAVYPGHRRDLK